MCGINGIIAKTYQNKDTIASIVNNMNNLIIHRGPDDDGVFTEENAQFTIGMGMRRLSIIDLSSGSNLYFQMTSRLLLSLMVKSIITKS